MSDTKIIFLNDYKKKILINFINNYSIYISRWNKNTYNKKYTDDCDFTYISLGRIIVDIFNNIKNKRNNNYIFKNIILELAPTLKIYKNVFFTNHKINNGNIISDEFNAFGLLMHHLKNNNSIDY